MLDDYKKLYEQQANIIPNWKKMDKNELCNLYLDNYRNETLRQAYISAIIARYWSLIPKYYGQSQNVATCEDVYEWLVDSIMYALRHKSWRRKGSSIYNDPTGPDKVINRCMKCRRLTYYQSINRQKRKDGALMESLDALKDEVGDGMEIQDESVEQGYSFIIDNYIEKYYDAKEYFIAVMMHCIAYDDVFSYDDELKCSTFDLQKLTRRILSIDDDFHKSFAEIHGYEFEKVKRNWDMYYSGLSAKAVQERTQNYLRKLKHAKFFEQEYKQRCYQTF